MTLGLTSQLELDLAVSRASAKFERAQKRAARKGATLKPISETTAAPDAPSEGAPAPDDAAAELGGPSASGPLPQPARTTAPTATIALNPRARAMRRH